MNEEIITTPQEIQEELSKPAKKINYTLIGWGALVLSLIGSYFLFLSKSNAVPASYLSPFVLTLLSLLFLLVFIAALHLSTRILKIPARSWSKALYSVGILALAGTILALLGLPFPPDSAIFSLIMSVVSIVISFVVLMKVYTIRFFKALSLFVVQTLLMIVVVLVLGIILIPLLGFGLLSLIG